MAVVDLHHVVEGPADAPVLVLLNSLGTDLAMWDPQAEALRADFRLVRLDTRGHGASPVPPGPYSVAELGGDVLALLDGLGIGRASFCGVSLGGATATWLAAHAPQRVDHLLACFTSAEFGPPRPWDERATKVRAAGVEAVAEAVLARWFTADLRERDPALVARMRAVLVATPAEGYAAAAEAVGAIDLRGDLADVVAPTLVVSGSADPVALPEHGRRLAVGIAGARFVELEGAAHLGNLERPEAVTELIRGRLSEEA